MGSFRSRVKNRWTAAKKQHDSALSTNQSRVVKAYRFARRAVSVVAKMARLPQHFSSLSQLKSRVIVNVPISNLSFPPSVLQPLTLGGFRFKKLPSPVSTPSLPPPPAIPRIIVTSPNGNETKCEDVPPWKKTEVAGEVRTKYQKWNAGEFLSPIYPVNAVREWKKAKKAERQHNLETKITGEKRAKRKKQCKKYREDQKRIVRGVLRKRGL